MRVLPKKADAFAKLIAFEIRHHLLSVNAYPALVVVVWDWLNY